MLVDKMVFHKMLVDKMAFGKNVGRQNGIWQNVSWKCQNIFKNDICQNGNLPNGG